MNNYPYHMTSLHTDRWIRRDIAGTRRPRFAWVWLLLGLVLLWVLH